MRSLLLRGGVAVAALVARATLGIKEDGVLVLKASNFENHVNEHYAAGVMVLFYAEWCEHCAKFLPEYAAAAEELAGEVTLAKIADADVAKQYDISTYPSIRWLRQGRVVEARASERGEVVRAARRLSQDRCRVLTTSVDEAFDARGVRVIGFFKSQKTKAAKAFLKAVDEFKYPVEFFIAASPELKAAAFERAGLNETAGPAMLLLKPYDELYCAEAVVEKKKIAKFIEREMMPKIVPFLPEYMDMIFSGPIQMHAIFAVDELTDALKATLYAAAEAHRGKILHLLMFRPAEDELEDENAEEARRQMAGVWDFLGIESTPALIVSDMTVATRDEPRGSQTKFEGDMLDQDAVIEFERPFAARHVARKAGLDPKMSEIMAEPKLQEMLKDPKMGTMFQIMGMPKKYVDLYKDEL